MANPLRNEDNAQPKDIQFSHFGVLNSGAQSKTSLFTSVGLNLVLLFIAVVIGAATKVKMENDKKIANLVVPIAEKKPEPPKPLPKPPKPLPRPPVIKPVEPKIKLPEVKIPDPPKVPVVRMEKPLPPVVPAPPKQVVAPAAPKPVPVSLAHAASVVNNDPHPSAVSLGRPDSPMAPSNRPATSAVALPTRGLAGMPASNMGGGPPARAVSLGSGQPNSGALSGNGSKAIAGVKLGGITGGTPGATGNGTGVRGVQLGQLAQATPPPAAAATHAPARSGPKVLFKPRPVYTAEATAMHLEGTVSIRIRVTSGGSVQVLGVTSGLGHGLDESAIRAIQATRFQPAVDATGQPIDWEGVVNITFQLAS